MHVHSQRRVYYLIYTASWEVTLSRIAKLFMNGRSQAIRLPSEFRFEGNQVNIRKDAETGDVILSRKPKNWEAFFKLRNELGGAEEDFLSERDPNFPPKRSLY